MIFAMRCAIAIVLVISIAQLGAHAGNGPDITLRDLPDTNGNWQEGAAVIPASRERIQQWLTDYILWPSRFPDIEWSQVLGDDDQGRHIVRFRSKIADAVLTVHEAVAPGLLVFEGTATFAHTQGRIHMIDLGNGTTRVLMQSTSEVHGLARLFATQNVKRQRAHQVATSHLTALWNLAKAATP
jgi:hypothetical protein